VPKAGYSKKIRLLKFKQTRLIYQDIIDGVTLIVTRAGGATVNDAIARRIPLVFVSEQGHWQVEAIRKEVEAQHLAAEGIPYEVFTEDPAEAVQEITRRVNDHGANTNITERMAGKAPEREFWLRQQLV